METAARTIRNVTSTALIIAFFVMFMLIFGNVVLRFLFSTGLTFSDEIARYAFVWSTFLGAAIAMQENAHIGITGIRGRLPARWHPLLDIVVNALMLLIALIVLVGSVEFLIANLGTRAPFTGAPIAISQASIVVGCIGLISIFAVRIWLALKSVR